MSERVHGDIAKSEEIDELAKKVRLNEKLNDSGFRAWWLKFRLRRLKKKVQ